MNYGTDKEMQANSVKQVKINILPMTDGTGQPLFKATNKSGSRWVQFFKDYPILAPIVVWGSVIVIVLGGTYLFISHTDNSDACSFGRKAINVNVSADGFVPLFTTENILSCPFVNSESASISLKNNASVQLKLYDSLINLNASMQEYVFKKIEDALKNLSISTNSDTQLVLSAHLEKTFGIEGDYTIVRVNQTVNVFKDTMMNMAQRVAPFFGIKL